MRNSSNPARHRALTSVFQLHFQSQTTTTKCYSDPSTVTKAPSFSSAKGQYRDKRIISFNILHQGSRGRKCKLLNLIFNCAMLKSIITSTFSCFPASMVATPLTLGVGQQNCSECRLENTGMLVGAKKPDAFVTRKILRLMYKGLFFRKFTVKRYQSQQEEREQKKTEKTNPRHFKDQNLSIMRSICSSI